MSSLTVLKMADKTIYDIIVENGPVSSRPAYQRISAVLIISADIFQCTTLKNIATGPSKMNETIAGKATICVNTKIPAAAEVVQNLSGEMLDCFQLVNNGPALELTTPYLYNKNNCNSGISKKTNI